MGEPYNRVQSCEMAAKADAIAERRRHRFWRRSRAQLSRDDGAPDGFRLLPRAEAWTDGTEVVVLAHPDDIDEDGDWHNCDAMGCGHCHAVARVDVKTDREEQLRADLARSRRRERQLRRAVLAHAGMRCYGRMVDARIQRDYARESGGAIAESVAAHWDERAKQQDRIGDGLMRRARDAASDGKEKPCEL